MPISRDKFEHRRIDLTFSISDLLASHSDLAFTVEDVREMFTQTVGRNATMEEVEQALEALVSEGRVLKAEIEGQRWYTMVKRRLGFLKE